MYYIHILNIEYYLAYFTLDYPKINMLIRGNWSHILSNIKNKKIYRKKEINGSLGRSSVRIAGVVSTLRMSTKRYKTSFSG